MVQETFPKFKYLPKEIQILIWEAAVRPVPGDRHVHRFFIAGYHLKHAAPLHNIKTPFLNLIRTKNFTYDSLNVSTGCSLAVPDDDADGNPNDSVYLSDSSLWSVCKESRKAMERRFSKNEWWSKQKAPFHPKRSAEPGQYLGQEGVTHTASYKNEDGIVKHITIDYQRDLIHLDPRYLNDVYWWNLLEEGNFLPLFDMRIEDSSTAKRSFVGDDIALDFDRSTYDTMRGKMVHFYQRNLQMYSSNFYDMVSLLASGAQRRVWFIDYALVPTAERDGKVFREGTSSREEPPATREIFSSDDFIYTEVKSEDIGPLWRLSHYDNAYDGENHHAFAFLDHLRNLVHLEDPSLLRVLACQPAPGRPARPRKPWSKRCHGHLTCEECHPKPVPRVRPSAIENEGSESSGDISDSDLNLFD
ncbi:hypothetical protein NW768_009617 [Fusarium equiseti]|uniref:2EXR domain-containing protein n=1 Tax=Fusarium equiseti TaxID=61235 RepID=A0ABQ8R2Z2_FUSEQ|nr:hypothetical protein NW768_009617 [Fusarium equiseti]